MIRLAITGSAGYLGQAVLRALQADPDVEHVLGIDIMPCPESDKVSYVHADVRDPELGRLFKEARVDGVLHLAFIIEAKGDLERMRDVNVNGTANVLRAAAEAGVDRFLLTSSLAVYGAWPDNPELLPEDLPPRPNPDDYYGQHKMQVEWLARNFAEDHPEIAVAIMRPCVIAGPTFNSPFFQTMKRAPFLPLPAKGRGQAQFIHEDDTAQLALTLVKNRVRGIFNAAGESTLPWRNVYERLGKPIVTLPRRLLDKILHVLWRTKILPVLPVQMGMIYYPVILSGERARRILGFRPRYSILTTLDAALSRP